MNHSPELNTKLKKCDTEIKEYIRALKSENLKLQRHIAKLEVNNLSKDNRIKALEKELKENRPNFEVHMDFTGKSRPPEIDRKERS